MSTKEIQGRFWSKAPEYWSAYFEPFFVPIYKKTLEHLQLNEDTMLLDAGYGSGLFSYMAISAGAQLIGVDAAPGLLGLARQRNPENNFLEQDLESLPFASNSFHVVTGFNSFHYAGSFSNALSEAKRVLKEGGRLVIAIWDIPEKCEATVILKAIGSLLPPPAPGTPDPFTLSEEGKIESICESIGLEMIYKAKVSCPFLYYMKNDAIKSFMGTAPAAAALNHVNEKTVQQTISKAFEPYHLTEDLYHLQNRFLLFIAKK